MKPHHMNKDLIHFLKISPFWTFIFFLTWLRHCARCIGTFDVLQGSQSIIGSFFGLQELIFLWLYVCVCRGTGICGQPFLQYPLCQSYVIFRLSQKACSFVGLCFFTVTQGSLYWEVYCPTKEAELYLLDCFHSIVHGSLVGGSMMFYESMKWNFVRTRRL